MIGKIRILVAEDDAVIREGLVTLFANEGWDVTAVRDGESALASFRSQPFDVVLLDIMMPKRNGYEVCRDIRRVNRQIPILMLTAKGEEIDKVLGLELGADDYVTKPFGVRELLARVAAVVRRTHRNGMGPPACSAEPFAFGAARVDPRRYTVTLEKDLEPLSGTELKLLRCFHAHPGDVLSRDDLLNAIWGGDYGGTTRTVDQHVARLRKKIERDPAHPKTITTYHGVGYRYCPD